MNGTISFELLIEIFIEKAQSIYSAAVLNDAVSGAFV